MSRFDDDDPLWLKSPVKRYAFRGACYLFFVWLGYALSGPLGAIVILVALITAQSWVDRTLGELWRRSKERMAQPEYGRHYAFSGQSLRIHDDGRELWIAEASLRKLLDLQRDPALKARFANEWRECAELGLPGKGLWIKVAALRQHLGDAPERMDPRRLKLRTYLDRDVLQPYARKRERGV